MGLLVDGHWADQWYDTASSDGHFVRPEAQFRSWITEDGRPGPTGTGGFAAEAGRYHLYVSLACPWAHRTLIFHALKGLEKFITVSVVNPHMGSHGWSFEPAEGVIGDPLFHSQYLYQLYQRAKPDYSGRVTVPLLWDKVRNTIVSNESADIIRMLNSAFDEMGARAGDFYPEPLRDEINVANTLIYDRINNGVYKAGFATSQHAYEEAITRLFETLEQLETRLGQHRYLHGKQITESDWRLFTTLIRFDAVYYGHFKCNIKRLVDYPNLWAYTRELYQWPGIAQTLNLGHVKAHYYRSHPMINPTGIVPAGPQLNLDQLPGRGNWVDCGRQA